MSVVSTTSSANLDGEDDDELRVPPKTSQNYIKMFNIGRELCFLLLIVFTTYASFNSSSTGGGSPPAPFFPRGSLVADFYRGELSEALSRASEGDVSFIMYYAPWDAESQMTRRHFMSVAHQSYKQVYFAGINCWQPRSDCRRTLSKIQQFPKLVAYVTHETGVEYRGPSDAQYMGDFLRGVMRPIHRLTSSTDLVRLRSTYNAVVVAHLNFKGMLGGPPYRAVYETALKFLERDVRQEVAFAVVTSFKTTLELGGDRTPNIKLYLWNETLDYPGHFSSDHLSEWITARLHQVSVWLSPPGVKSLTLAPYVNQGPALLMFTPRDNFVMYDLLREVGLEFFNCNNNTEVTQLAHNVSNFVSERISEVWRLQVSCQSRMKLSSTVQILPSVWANTSCDKQQCFALPDPDQCPTLMTPVDPLAAPALTESTRREKCRLLTPPPPRIPVTPVAEAVRGLACRYNKSLSLLALDSAQFTHFARGLGVDPELAKDKTRVLLVHSQMETTHVLGEPVTLTSLSQFLVNFTFGRLERFQRVQPLAPPPTTPAPPPSPGEVTTQSVHELDTSTFNSVALNDSLNVVVMFHTNYCGFCQAVSHMYLAVARLLRSVPSLVFTRLDGESNDLPWQFTPPSYPSILFFPARRKAESRVFNMRDGVTVDSLTQFVLANLQIELRLYAMLQLCHQFSQPQWTARRRECLRDVRGEVSRVISSQLARYRKLTLLPELRSPLHAAELRKVVSRLQHLRHLQLSLSVNSARGLSLSLAQRLLSLFSEPSQREPSEETPRPLTVKDEL